MLKVDRCGQNRKDKHTHILKNLLKTLSTLTYPVLESPPPKLYLGSQSNWQVEFTHMVLKNQFYFYVFEYFQRFNQYIIIVWYEKLYIWFSQEEKQSYIYTPRGKVDHVLNNVYLSNSEYSQITCPLYITLGLTELNSIQFSRKV